MEDIKVTDEGQVIAGGSIVSPDDVEFGFGDGMAEVRVNGDVVESVDPSSKEYEGFQDLQQRVAAAARRSGGGNSARKALAVAASNSSQLAELTSMISGQWEEVQEEKQRTREVREELAEAKRELQEAVSSGEVEVSVDVSGVEGEMPEGLVHHKQYDLIKLLGAGMHSLMVGIAGTGKTTAARKAAEALNLDFHKFQGHKHAVGDDLYGFISAANGEYVPGAAFEPVVEGGLLFIDELDVCTPSLVKACNSLTDDSDVVQFPHRTVEKHEDFIVCAAANTIGQGASELYTGASGQLDASSLDRFVFVDWPIDENIETSVAESYAGDDGLEWVGFVRSVRDAADDRGILLEISPRASIKGAKLLSAGFSAEEVKAMTLTNKMSENQRSELSDVLDGDDAEVEASVIEDRSLPRGRSIGDKMDELWDGDELRECIDRAESMARKRGDNKNYGVVAQALRDDTNMVEAAYALCQRSHEDLDGSEARTMLLEDLPFLICRAELLEKAEDKAELLEKAGVNTYIG